MEQAAILIPAYKPDHVRQAVESALAQDPPAAEVIISDDCPGEAVYQEVRDLVGNNRVAYHRNRPALGLAGNYLRLAELTRAPWLKYLDDDDILFPGALAGLRAAARDCPGAMLVIGGVRFQDEAGTERDLSPGLPPCLPGRAYLDGVWERNAATLFTRMLVRREVMEEIAGLAPPTRMISLDELVGFTAAILGNIAARPEVDCIHRIHRAGYSGSLDVETLWADFFSVLAPCQLARDRGTLPEEDLRRFRTRAVCKLARGTMTKLMRHGDHRGLKELWSRLWGLDRGLALRSLCSPRIWIKLAKSLG